MSYILSQLQQNGVPVCFISYSGCPEIILQNEKVAYMCKRFSLTSIYDVSTSPKIYTVFEFAYISGLIYLFSNSRTIPPIAMD